MSKRFAGSDISALLKRINLIELIKYLIPEYTGVLSTRGAHKSPFRDDRNPSFTIRTVNDIDEWKDWATGEYGTALEAVMKVRSVDYSEAIKFLIQWVKEFDPTLVLDEDNKLIEEVERKALRQKLLKSLLSASRDQLLHDYSTESTNIQDVQEWLLERGVSDLRHIAKFPVGVWDYDLIKPFLPHDQLKSLVSLSQRGNGPKALKDTHGLLFFYFSNFGNISAVKFRPCRSSSKESFFITNKKLGPADDVGFLGLDQFTSGDATECVLVEGEFDWLVNQSYFVKRYGEPANFICRGGSSGSSMTSFYQLKQLGFSVVTLWPDNDAGGDKFIEDSAKAAKSSDIILKVYQPTSYEARVPGLDQDPATVAAELKDADLLSHDMHNNTTLLPKFVANRMIQAYRRQTKQEEQDLRILKRDLVKTASEYDFGTFDLEDFCGFIETQLPEIKADKLQEAVSNSEKAFQKFMLGDDTWAVDNHGYLKRKFDRGSNEEYYSKVTNWTVRFDKIVTGEEREHSQITGNIFVDGRRVARFKENAEIFSSGNEIVKLVRANCPVGVAADRNLSEILPSLVSMTNIDVKQVEGITKIGYLPKEPVYITTNMVIADGTIITDSEEYEVNFSGADLPGCYGFTMENSKSMLSGTFRELIFDRLLNMMERHYTLYALGHIASSVCIPFLPGSTPPPTTLFHRAKKGQGKTTCAKVFMNLFSDWPMDRTGPSARSTRNALEKELHHFRNAPVFIDDVKGNQRDIKEIMMLVQSNYDQQGRQRLNQNLTSRRSYNMQCWGLMITGEDVPTDQASTISRMITLVTGKELNTNIVSELLTDSNRARLSSIMPHFIAWLQRNKEIEYIDLPKLPKEEQRAWYQIRTILTGLDAFFRFAVEELEFPEAHYRAVMDEAHGYSRMIYDENYAASSEMAQDVQFMECLLELLASGEATLVNEDTNLKGTQVGSIRGQTIYLMPNQCISAVSRKLGRTFVVNDLGQDLYQSGYLIKGPKGIIHRPRINGSQVRAWVLNRGKIDLDPTFFSTLEEYSGQNEGTTINDEEENEENDLLEQAEEKAPIKKNISKKPKKPKKTSND